MSPQQRDAYDYIGSVDEGPKVEWFDEDFSPDGPSLRQTLRDMGVIAERYGRLFRVSAGVTR